jgi:Zn-dependent peptidase ImmA (M78 family)
MSLRKNQIRERAREQLEVARVKSAPIDIDKIARSANVKLIKQDLDNEISGVLKIEEDGSAVVIVNATHPPNRQRFTIAHELGHFFLHHKPGIHIDKVFLRDASSGEGLHTIEIEANRFAAELLMPDSLVQKELEKQIRLNKDAFWDTDNDILTSLADKFKVSTHAMSIKLAELGYSFQPF